MEEVGVEEKEKREDHHVLGRGWLGSEMAPFGDDEGEAAVVVPVCFLKSSNAIELV